MNEEYQKEFSRRAFLVAPVALACSAEASPGLSTAELPLLVAEGDSLTAGKDSWAHQLDCPVVIVAKGGATQADTLTEAAVQVDPLYQPGAIATLWAGTNDVALWSTPPDRLLARAQEWIEGRAAKGFRVAAFTMLPRAAFSPQQSAIQVAFSDALIAAPGKALIVDVRGVVPGMPGDGKLYSADGIHLTRDGQALLLASTIAPAIERLRG